VTLDSDDKTEVAGIVAEEEKRRERFFVTWPALITLIIAALSVFVGTVYSFHSSAKNDLQGQIDKKADEALLRSEINGLKFTMENGLTGIRDELKELNMIHPRNK
jgi:hypothetical protein